MKTLLKVHSIESLGALDGPGLRTVIFLTGCPLRCAYCHNPDMWTHDNASLYDPKLLLNNIRKMRYYFKNGGGVTLSGGDPLVQAEALIPFVKALKEENIHVALDTSGALWNSAIEELLPLVDLVLLDVKHSDTDQYKILTKGQLKDTQFFLNKLIEYRIHYWIRQVIVPDINDNKQQIQILDTMTKSLYRDKIEFLPFHKQGLYKWDALGLRCPLTHTAEMNKKDLDNLIRETLLL